MKTKIPRHEPPRYSGPVWQSQQRPSHAPPLRKVARWVSRHRRLFAALLLCLAAATAVQALTPSPPATTTVLLAARDLSAGHSLSDGDLEALAVNPQMVPDGALMPDEAWAGSQVSGPLRRGEVLTDASLLGTGLLTGTEPGSQAVPIRLSDPSTLALLRQGQLVTVVLSSSAVFDGPATNEVLAESVPVLWTPALATHSAGLLPAQEYDGMVVVAATAEQAIPLAGAISRGKVFLILLN